MNRQFKLPAILVVAVLPLVVSHPIFGQSIESKITELPTRYKRTNGYSSQEIEVLRKEWPQMVERVIKVEGRAMLANPFEMHMQKGWLKYVLPKRRPIPLLLKEGESQPVVVSGRITKIGKEHLFVIGTLDRISSDIEFVNEQRQILRAAGNQTPPPKNLVESWSALADWSRNRGAYYSDEGLKKAANEMDHESIQVEFKLADKSDAKRMLDILKRAKGREITEPLISRLRHEVLLRRWALAKELGTSALKSLLEEIVQHDPAAGQSVKEFDVAFMAKYEQDRVGVFATASEKQRTLIRRAIVVDIKTELIMNEARPDGSNGKAIAERIEREIPERLELVQQWWMKQLDWEIPRVSTYSRTQLVDLVKKLEQHDRTDDVERVKRAWVQARESRYRNDGPSGLSIIADDYLTIMNDREKATGLLMRAYEKTLKSLNSNARTSQTPENRETEESREIGERLRHLGFVRHEGEWITREAFEAIPEDPVVVAMREGRVVEGMTHKQVAGTLGPPRRVVRFATAGELREVWMYGEQSGQMSVHFQRQLDNRKPAHVVGFTTQEE